MPRHGRDDGPKRDGGGVAKRRRLRDNLIHQEEIDHDHAMKRRGDAAAKRPEEKTTRRVRGVQERARQTALQTALDVVSEDAAKRGSRPGREKHHRADGGAHERGDEHARLVTRSRLGSRRARHQHYGDDAPRARGERSREHRARGGEFRPALRAEI